MKIYNIYVNGVYRTVVKAVSTHDAKATYLQNGGRLLLSDKITAFEQDDGNES